MGMDRKILTGISPRSWEHPADRAALKALKDVPGLSDVVKFFLGMIGDKAIRLLFLGSSVRVNEKQFPKINALVDEACRTLDLDKRPDVYVTQRPELNAGAIGVRDPIVMLNSSLLDTLNDEETLGVIAHEIAHIMSGHVLYKTLLWFLLNMAAITVRIPVAQIVLLGVQIALLEWDRKSELSADRAGLLVVQDLEVSKTLLMKLAGGKHIEEMDTEEFMKQAEEYEGGGDVLDGVYKVLNSLGNRHPFAVVRYKAIHDWGGGEDYQKILGGEYQKRTDEERSFAEEFEEARKNYRDEMRQSKDPFAKTMNDIGEGLEKAGKEAVKFFESLIGKK